MSTSVLTIVVLGPAAIVVAALFAMLWLEGRSAPDRRTALTTGAALALWAVLATVLAYRGVFEPKDTESVPPVAINMAIVLVVIAASVARSRSLRGLLTNQQNLIRLHLWRLEGIVFLTLMWHGQMPALWALPAGIGDILVAIAAPWIAGRVHTVTGQRRAVIWNLLGLADLVVAVGLGIVTSPGPLQLFDTTPTSEVITRFPLALVPAFLVPLALSLHIISLWQLLAGTWAPPHRLADRSERR